MGRARRLDPHSFAACLVRPLYVESRTHELHRIVIAVEEEEGEMPQGSQTHNNVA